MPNKEIAAKITSEGYSQIERLASEQGVTVSAWVYDAIQKKAFSEGVTLPTKRQWVKKGK